MSGDERPIVARPVPRNADGTLSVPTTDHGLLRLVCPSWCRDGHTAPAPVDKADICHRSEPVWALSVTEEYGEAGHLPVSFLQFPFRANNAVYLVLEDQPDGDLEFGPNGARKVAESLRAHANVIDGMAVELEQIRGAGR
ncbi:DUF6907 domain-containing protein [Streptomyces niveus]|uniref:DUF6907 domain-containing protein n=1 Tax=Streptomyces niveus TaxID=193462 RepID=UPI00084C92FA|nr:hypothetical protein [Streptomyces niveus]